MQFNTSVVGCQWIEASGQWKVDLQTQMPTGEMKLSTEMCDILLHSTGVLNKIAWPKIEGLQDFKGKVIHSADWPEDYTQEQWQEEKVAVIGSGATSIQIVPNMQVRCAIRILPRDSSIISTILYWVKPHH
jgi:hydroxyversicolorone monooxygenase